MFKVIIGLMMAILVVGCDNKKVDELESRIMRLRETNSNLQTELVSCNQKNDELLSQYGGMVVVNPSKEEEKPSEPEYETVEYYIVDGTKCSNASLDNDTDISCGISFWGCKDGVIRRCMTNVKYTIKEEKQLIEQE